MSVPERVKERFWSRVAVGEPDACWPWLMSIGSHGYGQIGWGGNNSGRGLVLAHRLHMNSLTVQSRTI